MSSTLKVLHDSENINEIKDKLYKDADTYGQKPRFGYFSIPYPSSIGDRLYSSGKIRNLDENKKIRTEPRNIQVNPTRKGKGFDVYFSNFVKEDEKSVDLRRKIAEKEKSEFSKTVNDFKENKGKFVAPFRPSGPQELRDLYFYFI